MQMMVILIDTGRASQLNFILAGFRELLKKYGKTGSALVVSTHYDFDHIRCLQAIVGCYKIHIREVWMHQTSRLIKVTEKLEGMEDVPGLIFSNEEAQELKIEGNGIIDYDNDDIQDILHQLKHEVEALATLKEMGIPLKDPIRGSCSFPGWPEIEVIGPTYDYYKSLFLEHFDLFRFIKLEKSEIKAGKEDEESTGKDAFENLDDFKRIVLTPTNLYSAII